MEERLRVRLQRKALRVARRALTPPPNVDQRLEDLIEVGRRSYPARPNVVHFGTYSARLTIGAFCSIADSVEFILDGDHRVDWVTTFPIRIAFGLPEAGTDGHPATRGDITVGNDVWIGRGATILSGVTVGDGAVIGARSVVARDVPPYGIAVGNPAQVARFRFSDDVIEALLRIRWWEWPDPVIEQRVGELCDTSVRDFVAKYNPADGSSHEVPRS